MLCKILVLQSTFNLKTHPPIPFITFKDCSSFEREKRFRFLQNSFSYESIRYEAIEYICDLSFRYEFLGKIFVTKSRVTEAFRVILSAAEKRDLEKEELVITTHIFCDCYDCHRLN